MLYRLLLLCLLCAPVQARTIIIGDSLSSQTDSWSTYIEDAHIHAQNGRTITHYQPPRDLVGHAGEQVIYFLGGNDIGRQSVHNGNTAGTKEYLLDHLRFFTSRGFKVLVIIPPIFDIEAVLKSNKKHRRMFKSITMEGVDFYDSNKVWDSSKTTDGLHPNSELSYELAEEIKRVLWK